MVPPGDGTTGVPASPRSSARKSWGTSRWSIPPSGGTAKPLVPIAVQEFDWGPTGIIFNMNAPGSSYPCLWMLKGGPSGTLVRLTAPGPSDADYQPSFRRNP